MKKGELGEKFDMRLDKCRYIKNFTEKSQRRDIFRNLGVDVGEY